MISQAWCHEGLSFLAFSHSWRQTNERATTTMTTKKSNLDSCTKMSLLRIFFIYFFFTLFIYMQWVLSWSWTVQQMKLEYHSKNENENSRNVNAHYVQHESLCCEISSHTYIQWLFFSRHQISEPKRRKTH